jgi:hypothetical protein
VYITVFQLNRVNSSTADTNKNAYSVAGLKAQKDCQQPKEASLDKKKRGDFSIFIAENVPTEKGILVIWMKKVFRS